MDYSNWMPGYNPNYLAYDPEYQKMMNDYLRNNPTQGLPREALSSPTPTNAMLSGNQSPLINNPTTKTATGWDPWSIGLTAGMAAAPIAGSLLGKSKAYPSGGGGAPSLGMTRGAEVPNAYGGRTNPLIQALLAQYLRRR